MSEDSSLQEKGYPTADDMREMQKKERARRETKKSKRKEGRIWRRADGGKVRLEEAEKEKKSFRRKHAMPGNKDLPPGTSTAAPKPKPPGWD